MKETTAEQPTHAESIGSDHDADTTLRFEVTYYTDPLCCWCWAFEPVWQQLRRAMGERMRHRYRMAGLVRDWNTYEDPVNVVHRPAQMGPICAQVRHLTGTMIADRIWIADPPGSSWPACMAVKAAQRQSEEAAEVVLRLLREAVMLQCRNIARRDVLLEIAAEGAQRTTLDVERFERDIDGAEAAAAFRDDLGEIAFRQIGRFPAMAMRPDGGRGAILVGYRPWPALKQTIHQLWPGVLPQT